MLMKGPIRELLAVGPQQVTLRLPEGLRAQRVRLLRAGLTPQTTKADGRLTIGVPSILDHEVIAIDIENDEEQQ
jgi:hypothetical protein